MIKALTGMGKYVFDCQLWCTPKMKRGYLQVEMNKQNERTCV